MKAIRSLLPLVLSKVVFAAPTVTLQERATEICGQWDTVVAGPYTVYQNLWNEAKATSGSQCTTVNSYTQNLAWSTSWTWQGASNQVKSYANAALTMASIKKISAIKSIPSTWKWDYTGSSIVADVSYDMFTSSSATGAHDYEIMIWLGALGGAGPISSTGSAIATPEIGGVSFKLYKGPNGSTTVYSFVAASKTTSFSGDLLEFYTYLESEFSFPSSQYLLSIGAGTEPFTGSDAVFATTEYNCVVN